MVRPFKILQKSASVSFAHGRGHFALSKLRVGQCNLVIDCSDHVTFVRNMYIAINELYRDPGPGVTGRDPSGY